MPGVLLTFDLAATVGWTFGEPGGSVPPVLNARRLKGANMGAKFAACDMLIRHILKEVQPDEVGYEEPIPFGRPEHGTIGIEYGYGWTCLLQMACYDFGIGRVVKEAAAITRKNTMGKGTFPRGKVKPAVMAWCHSQGVRPPDDNAGDSYVLWRRIEAFRLDLKFPGVAKQDALEDGLALPAEDQQPAARPKRARGTTARLNFSGRSSWIVPGG